MLLAATRLACSAGLAQTKIMAKIETWEGLVAADEIIEASDSILFSRGNLGVCLDPEKVGAHARRGPRPCTHACTYGSGCCHRHSLYSSSTSAARLLACLSR